MSSMRSASSSTRYSTPASLAYWALEVIEQAARRGDDDVDAAAEGVLLRAHADAAVDRGAGQRRVHGERVEVLENLRGELARRRQHQRPRRPARLLDQPVQDRQQEGRGLAAAGLRAGEHVAARHRRGNRFGLNRRGSHEAELADSFEQIGMEAKRSEGHQIRVPVRTTRSVGHRVQDGVDADARSPWARTDRSTAGPRPHAPRHPRCRCCASSAP